MGFLPDSFNAKRPRGAARDFNPELLVLGGCRLCPLQHAPKALSAGAERPEVYCLGEAVGSHEAERGEPFVGPSGRLLRRHIPERFRGKVRFGNVVSSFPQDKLGKYRTPTETEIRCCSGYLTDDIERSQPKVIIGLGNTPLQALTGQSGVTALVGKRFPIQVGSHRCWYIPLVNPAAVFKDKGKERDAEADFANALRNAFAQVERLPEPVIVTPEEARADVFPRHRDLARIIDILDHVSREPFVGFDWETNALRPYGPEARILTFAVATPSGAWGFPVDHREAAWEPCDRKLLDAAIRRFLLSPAVKVAHNVSFEAEWALSRYGIAATRANLWDDTLGMAFLLEGPRGNSLDVLCQRHFGLNLKALSPVDVKHLDDEPLEEVCRYNAIDAKFHLRLFGKLGKAIVRAGLRAVYEHHLQRTLAAVRMQAKGLLVDAAANAAFAKDYEAKRLELQQRLHAQPAAKTFARCESRVFNPSAPADLKKLLGAEGIKVAATDEATLATVDHPFVKLVQDWRGVIKAKSTYVDPLSPSSPLVYASGRIHPSISTSLTRTGRTSASDPNVQNFPKRTAEEALLRRQIVPAPGHTFLSVDYSSVQARCVAMESGDKNLLAAFRDHYDIHADWRDRIAKRYPAWAKGKDKKPLRHSAKNKLVFPLFFGAQPPSISVSLGIPKEIVFQLYDDFWKAFPDIKGWQERLHRFYARQRYVTGLSGYRRYAPISPTEVINSSIQADEALLVCDAMVRLSDYEDEVLQPCMLVHDDLTLEIPDDKWDHYVDIVLTEMTRITYPWVSLPMAVEASKGKTWADLVEFGKFETDAGGYREYKE